MTALIQPPVNNIYRFKFTPDIVDYLCCFAKKHQYVDRITYKEAWAEWLIENEEVIELESNRLQMLGYDGDVKDKMFKAARYYFRKKSSEKPNHQTRKNYVTIDHNILNLMDVHIERNMKVNGYSPANGYSDFCNFNINFLEEEVNRLLANGLNKTEISDKIKKTYKNRYFIISRS